MGVGPHRLCDEAGPKSRGLEGVLALSDEVEVDFDLDFDSTWNSMLPTRTGILSADV